MEIIIVFLLLTIVVSLIWVAAASAIKQSFGLEPVKIRRPRR